MKIGVINLSTEFGESYLKAFKKNGINVTTLTVGNFENEIVGLNGVIICEDSTQDTAHTCSILLKLKATTNVRTWVFSSNFQKVMRSVYLQLGVLGVVSEEYEPDELQLVISNHFSRSDESIFFVENQTAIGQEKTRADNVQLISRNHSVKINGLKEIPLTRLEYQVMELLYEHKNNTVSYKELFEGLWGEGFSNQNYRVANLIFHLREKIADSSGSPLWIRTVRSKGYMLSLEE